MTAGSIPKALSTNDRNNHDNILGNSIVQPNSIVQGDCLEVLARIPNNAIDLTVCSPPYDAIRNYHGDWCLDFHTLGLELYRITRQGGAAIIVIGDATKDFAKSLTTARLTLDWCDSAEWRLFEQCIYQRAGNPGAWWSKRFRVDHESILIFFKGKRPKTFDKTSLMVPSKHAGKTFAGTDRQTDGTMKQITAKVVNPMKCRGTVWHYAASNTEGNRIKKQHPATFPDKLARDLIACFSREGDLVLDPFAGSGTTCVMAAQAGRRFIGIDIAGQYCEVARDRLRTEAGICQIEHGDFAESLVADQRQSAETSAGTPDALIGRWIDSIILDNSILVGIASQSGVVRRASLQQGGLEA